MCQLTCPGHWRECPGTLSPARTSVQWLQVPAHLLGGGLPASPPGQACLGSPSPRGRHTPVPSPCPRLHASVAGMPRPLRVAWRPTASPHRFSHRLHYETGRHHAEGACSRRVAWRHTASTATMTTYTTKPDAITSGGIVRPFLRPTLTFTTTTTEHTTPTPPRRGAYSDHFYIQHSHSPQQPPNTPTPTPSRRGANRDHFYVQHSHSQQQLPYTAKHSRTPPNTTVLFIMDQVFELFFGLPAHQGHI